MAMASERSDRIACTQADGPDAKKAACTRLHESGKLTNHDRSAADQARGMFWREKGERERATDFNEALRLTPNDPDVYNNRGIVWIDVGDVERALSDFNESVLHAPEIADSAIYENRGDVWREQKRDFERAISDYSNPIRLDARDSKAYLGRGLAWKELGQFDRAIADYTIALRFSPKSERAYAYRGESRRLKGDLDQALSDQDMAVALNTKGFDGYFLRGDTRRVPTVFERVLVTLRCVRPVRDHRACGTYRLPSLATDTAFRSVFVLRISWPGAWVIV